jgi:NAD(P)-dependent dehydrogenase (short-subunit alcohol dehydrogenase family)
MTTILITGGGRGIGLTLARAYVAAGATVIRALRDPAKAASDEPGLGEVLPLDVTDGGSVAALAERLHGRPIDILVNNAGVIGPDRQSAWDTDFDGFLETLKVNTLGPLRVTQALLPNLRLSTNGPQVAIISSRMGSLSYAKSDSVAYRASKAAVNKIAQALATDLAPEGIAVASIHPGWVRTDMGGPGADIDPATSADGVRAVIDALTVVNTGRFLNYDGAEMAW